MAIGKQEMIYLENWLADRIEPLVVSLAALSDETRQVLETTRQEIERRNEEARQLRQRNEEIQKQMNQLQQDTVTRLRKEIGYLSWRFILAVILAGVMAGIAAPTAYVLWEYQYSATARRMQNFEANYNRLPPQVRAILDGK